MLDEPRLSARGMPLRHAPPKQRAFTDGENWATQIRHHLRDQALEQRLQTASPWKYRWVVVTSLRDSRPIVMKKYAWNIELEGDLRLQAIGFFNNP
jgi:hypothetical protein